MCEDAWAQAANGTWRARSFGTLEARNHADRSEGNCSAAPKRWEKKGEAGKEHTKESGRANLRPLLRADAKLRKWNQN